jgi:CBS domain-containing protein
MLIQHILATKGGDVVSVRADATVTEAVATLRANRIGAVIVSDDEGATVSGILSERDVVRVLADDGPAALERTVAEVMTAEVFTCDPSATLEQLMGTMTEKRIRHIPVVADGRLVGVVSIGDVVKHRLGELSQEARTLHDYVTSGR